MDILSIAPQTITVDIKSPATGKSLGITVEVQSMESDEVKAVQRQIRNRSLKSGRNAVTAEKIEDGSLAILAATIVGWKWEKPAKAKGEKGEPEEPTLGGVKNPPCTADNKAQMLKLGWFAGQIDAAVGDESAFFTK
jgi:hypothetical protein